MNMKKTTASLLISAMMMTGSTAAFAANAAPLCDVADCYLIAEHAHNGVTYAGHYAYDGHDCHQVCTFTDCAKTGTHSHDGCLYNGHTTGDGHNHHNSGTGHGHGKNRHH